MQVIFKKLYKKTRVKFSELYRTLMISGTFNFMIGAARSSETQGGIPCGNGGSLE